jgi:hypothetical protein
MSLPRRQVLRKGRIAVQHRRVAFSEFVGLGWLFVSAAGIAALSPHCLGAVGLFGGKQRLDFSIGEDREGGADDAFVHADSSALNESACCLPLGAATIETFTCRTCTSPPLRPTAVITAPNGQPERLPTGETFRRGIAATAPRRGRSKQKSTLIRQCSTSLAPVMSQAGRRVAPLRRRYATAAETAAGGRWRAAVLFGSPRMMSWQNVS